MEQITSITEKGIELGQVIVKTVEEANSLTLLQKEALNIVFHDIEITVENILRHEDIPIQIKIMQMISLIIKTLQDVSAMKIALTGADKKAVALECGRKCIKMIPKDHLDILMLYDTIAEPTLETMLDLSRTLKSAHEQLKKIEKQEPSAECCLDLFGLCMSLKNK